MKFELRNRSVSWHFDFRDTISSRTEDKMRTSMSEGARATRNPDSSITVKESMTKSTEAWIRDLLALFENAQELYPDMMWRMQGEHDSVVWGHKGK